MHVIDIAEFKWIDLSKWVEDKIMMTNIKSKIYDICIFALALLVFAIALIWLPKKVKIHTTVKKTIRHPLVNLFNIQSKSDNSIQENIEKFPSLIKC